jgi:hypothetical protein
MCAQREFVSVLAQFVGCQMICLAVGGGGGLMGMGCLVVKFRSSIVRALGHSVLLDSSDANRLQTRLARADNF